MSPEEETERLKKKIQELEEALERKEKDYKKLKKEFDEFKAMHAVTVSNLQEALKIKADKVKSSKPLGLPKGHKGYFRHVPERWDEVQLKLNTCPHCNIRLPGRVQEERSRYVTDVELTLKAKNTKYIIPRKYCPACKKLVEPEVPNVLPHARLGLNLMLLVMYLKLGLRLPCEKIVDFLSTAYGVKMSNGEVIVILKQLAGAFGNYYSHLEKLVRLARVKHSDTTSWRVNGRNYFAWAFISTGVVLYKIRKRNNHKVGLTVFGQDQKGNVLVVDRHAAFRTLAEKLGFLLQLCWAHILQDTKELAETFGNEGRYVHRKLKEIYAYAKGLNHRGAAEHVQQLQGMVFELTQRHYKHITVRRFVNNLYFRDVENLFRFVTDPEVASTNNVSERELRHLVMMRKVSNGSRSQRGAAATAILTSVIQTLRFRKENVLLGLQQILKNPSGY
jgi:transposase